jgi:small subunit ribosomal protein S21
MVGAPALRRASAVRRGGKRVTHVTVGREESFESALKRFNKKVQQDRVLSEVRRRRFYEKPSVLRKKKKAAKRRKSRKQTLKHKYD